VFKWKQVPHHWMYDQQGVGFEEVVFEVSQVRATQYIRCK